MIKRQKGFFRQYSTYWLCWYYRCGEYGKWKRERRQELKFQPNPYKRRKRK